MESQRLRLAAVALAIAIGAAAAAVIAPATPPFVPRIRVVAVTVRGIVETLPPGYTFAQAIGEFGLRASAGDLLDVDGAPLVNGLYAGAVLLNGRASGPDEPLADGDVVTVRNGKDQTEPTVTQIVHIPGGRPGNPQFLLGNAPGDQIVVKGSFSGEIASSVFRATGPVDRPLAVALTFDDGPWPGSTRKVLAILARYQVKATFFLVGNVSKRRPELVQAERRAGMSIGNHSWDHPIRPPFNKLPKARITSEISKTNDLLISLGANVSLFRPPGGSYSTWMSKEASRFGDRLILWSVDPRDWAPGKTAKQIARSVLSHVRPGSIILMHDGGGDRSATVKALPVIIRGIRKMGLGFQTLS